MATYAKSGRSQAYNWFLHRITGTFLIFMLITHFWVQHYDSQLASVTHSVVVPGEEQAPETSEAVQSAERVAAGGLPEYPEAAVQAVRERRAAGLLPPRRPGEPEVTSYDVVMTRLADPVYAVLWKGFNILFLIFALHHGFYGLNNVLGDYIRNDMVRAVVRTLTWTVALVLLVIGLYSVITAGWGLAS
jgi:succinate dehydrogenase / fumarate reductase, membrane anchor subunit